MHTESEAKKMWCPMTNAGRGGDGPANKCLASGCAMWRWNSLAKPNASGDDPRGYCGLAGKPGGD